MELNIEKLIYGGDGLARMPAASAEAGRGTPSESAGKAVFVPFVLPGERVEAAITEEKPGFARARLAKILERSPRRVEPGCPYFGRCGGCHYQHASYEAQLEIKAGILRETLARLAKVELQHIEAHASPPWNYRNRTRLKVKAGGDFALGYYRMGSHALLPVRECPISSPLINRAMAAMWKLGEAGGVPEDIAEIEFFTDSVDERLLIELIHESAPAARDARHKSRGPRHGSRPSHIAIDWQRLAEFAAALRAVLPAVAGVAVLRQNGEGNAFREEPPQRWKSALAADALVYVVDQFQYRVSAGSFFQANRFLASQLLALATADRSGERALDLYAGTGLFTLPLAHSFREVVAVEAAPNSFADLKENAPANVSIARSTTEKFLASLPPRSRFDYIIADPPRGGLGERVARSLAAIGAPQITYVSCDPATLARDVRVLREAGYEIRAAHLVDLFPQTFHIETVLHLKR